MAIPAPSGPCGVGSVTCQLTDASRPLHLASRAAGRSLFIKLWYPTNPNEGSERELLWDQLRTDVRAPVPMRLLLKCIRKRTATQPLAPMKQDAWTSSVVIYNHGFISFASENTALMEHLASQGYIAIAVQHLEQLPELQALNRSQSPPARAEHQRLTKHLVKASPQEKARLAPEYFESATNTNRIVVERAVDTIFVLDHLNEVLSRIPAFERSSRAVATVHLVGFSAGGAVSSETAKRGQRARSVVNLDGGLYGSQDHTEIHVPYLMMYSSASEGINDELLPQQAQRITPRSTRHLNYHDIAGLMPFLRYFGAIGTTDAEAFLAYRNKVVCEFIAAAERAATERTIGAAPGSAFSSPSST